MITVASFNRLYSQSFEDYYKACEYLWRMKRAGDFMGYTSLKDLFLNEDMPMGIGVARHMTRLVTLQKRLKKSRAFMIAKAKAVGWSHTRLHLAGVLNGSRPQAIGCWFLVIPVQDIGPTQEALEPFGLEYSVQTVRNASVALQRLISAFNQMRRSLKSANHKARLWENRARAAEAALFEEAA